MEHGLGPLRARFVARQVEQPLSVSRSLRCPSIVVIYIYTRPVKMLSFPAAAPRWDTYFEIYVKSRSRVSLFFFAMQKVWKREIGWPRFPRRRASGIILRGDPIGTHTFRPKCISVMLPKRVKKLRAQDQLHGRCNLKINELLAYKYKSARGVYR